MWAEFVNAWDSIADEGVPESEAKHSEDNDDGAAKISFMNEPTC